AGSPSEQMAGMEPGRALPLPVPPPPATAKAPAGSLGLPEPPRPLPPPMPLADEPKAAAPSPLPPMAGVPPTDAAKSSPGQTAPAVPARPLPPAAAPETPKPPGDQLAMAAPPPAQLAPAQPATQPATTAGPLRAGRAPVASMQLAEIEFAPGALTLTADDNRRLADAVKVYEQRGGIMRVVGYGRRGYGADAAQQELASFSKAIERANVVARTLAQLGLPSNRIVVQAAPVGDGLGEDRAEVLLEN
ncbi:MAG TPA: hypothetical protein VF502_08105, partial [Stellaceae bacterium]